jgi:hypothetical protein
MQVLTAFRSEELRATFIGADKSSVNLICSSSDMLFPSIVVVFARIWNVASVVGLALFFLV